MKDRTGLVEKFAKAGLRLELAEEPIRKVGNTDIFQLDIPRKLKGNRRTEWFRIWPGHDDNLVNVRATDLKRKQVVLTVREASREFEEVETWRTEKRRWESKKPEIPKVGDKRGTSTVLKVRRKDGKAHITWQRTTPKSVRHFLAGLDERQLFICQLPRSCSSVNAAHACLKRPELITHEGKAPGRTIRQGEWFFVNTTPEEREVLNTAIEKNRLVPHKNQPIEQQGNPHTATEVVRVSGNENFMGDSWARRLNRKLEHGWPIRSQAVYVRGKVSHVDHATVKFAQWRKVIRNNERGSDQANPSSAGVFWID